jgi:hypothetical protein
MASVKIKTQRIFLWIGIIALILFGAFIGLRFYTKSFSPERKANFEQNNLRIGVDYCSPQKGGREIFGKLVPFGKVWRTGANEATEIEFNQDVRFGGSVVKKGRYALFTIPQKDKWTVILNSVLGQWGHFTYDTDKDVLRIDVPVRETPKSREGFEIGFRATEKGAEMSFQWDKTQVLLQIETP